MKSFTKFLGESAAVAIARTTPAQGRKAGIAALLTLTLAIGITGCSHSKKPLANSSQNSQTQNQSAQAALPVVPAATTAQPEVAKKKSVKGPVRKLPVNRTYIDETSGLSFTYPRRSTLEVGDKAEQDGVVSQQLAMNFVAEGGVTMAVVELPGIAKTGSDFTPAFFTISVNKELSAEQCGEFAGQESAGTTSDSSSQSVLPVSGSRQTLGEVEYSELDKQNDDRTMKYYHRFVAGATPSDNACYEFAMSVKAAAQSESNSAVSSDSQRIDAFSRLEKILASVNIKGESKAEAVVSAKEAKPAIDDRQ